jgi:hypothetical protein
VGDIANRDNRRSHLTVLICCDAVMINSLIDTKA